jgi:hypothetical protein
MTGDGWLRSVNVAEMLAHVRGRLSARKLRLFACACHRWQHRRWRGPSDQVEALAERLADGLADAAEVAAARTAFSGPRIEAALLLPDAADAAEAVTGISERVPNPAWPERSVVYACLLHEIAGNPFRAAALDPAWLCWGGGTVRQLAQAAYEEQRFGILPILADALEEAGCTNPEILGHCRSGLRHFRGCWAVDLLLEKT